MLMMCLGLIVLPPCGQKNQLLWIEFQKVIILFSTPSNGVKTAWIVIIKIKLALCIFRNSLVPGEFSSQSGLILTKVKYISPHGGSWRVSYNNKLIICHCATFTLLSELTYAFSSAVRRKCGSYALRRWYCLTVKDQRVGFSDIWWWDCRKGLT